MSPPTLLGLKRPRSPTRGSATVTTTTPTTTPTANDSRSVDARPAASAPPVTSSRDAAHRCYLASRCPRGDIREQWPIWLTLGPSLWRRPSPESHDHPHEDSQYHDDDDDDEGGDDSVATKDCPDWTTKGAEWRRNRWARESCANCGQSALHHRVALLPPDLETARTRHHGIAVPTTATGGDLWSSAQCLAQLRNLRCVTKLGMRPPPLSTAQSLKTPWLRSDSVQRFTSREQQRHNAPKVRESFLRRWAASLQHEHQHLVRCTAWIPDAPGQSWDRLRAKVTTLHQTVAKLLSCLSVFPEKNRDSNPSSSEHAQFTLGLRVIVACDDVYYQLYSLHVRGLDPTTVMAMIVPPCSLEQNDDPNLLTVPTTRPPTSSPCLTYPMPIPIPTTLDGCENMELHYFFLPHPSEYFGGIDYFTNDGATNQLQLERWITPARQSRRAIVALQQWFAIDNKHPRQENPLSSLHFYRMTETVTILASIANLAETTDRSSKLECRSGNRIGDGGSARVHLDEWRDSSRAFICGLYSHATLADSTFRKLASILYLTLGCRKILEWGSGNGYVAVQLQRLSTSLSPPEGPQIQFSLLEASSNASSIAIYCADEASNTAALSFIEINDAPIEPTEQQRTQNPSANMTALILCFPHSQSSMALDAARRFVADDHGLVIVHIGEFEHVTSPSTLEAFLVKEFACLEKLPCLASGVDGSSVTVWAHRGLIPKLSMEKSTDTGSNLLLPCSQCRRVDAVKRSRLLQNLRYCSTKCFSQHTKIRSHLLRMVTSDATSSLLGFDDQTLYMDLQKQKS